MYEHVVRRIQMTLVSGKSDLRFTADTDVETLLACVMDSDPRLLWFLHSYRYEKRGRDYRLFFTYKNRSTNLHDVQVAADQKGCFDCMCRAVSAHAGRLILCVKQDMEVEKITDLFHRKYAAAYPNLGSFQVMTHSFMGSYCVLECIFSYRVGGVHLAVWEKECEKECRRVADLLFLPDMPDEVKIYLVHNYLAHTVTYDLSAGADTIYSAYGALCRHRCVCHGIADAMLRILRLGCVPCEIITGVARGENHAWNLVKTKAGWHHLDATWDLSEGRGIRYDYYLVGDSAVVSHRTYDRSLYPACVAGGFLKREAQKYLESRKWELLRAGVDARIL